MKFLHISFHKGCELEIEYVLTTLGHTVETMTLSDTSIDNNIYKISEEKANLYWHKHMFFFNTFDGIITSDTCANCRTFLQNNYSKILLIWICNRFDYALEGDNHFYNLINSIKDRPKSVIIANTAIEIEWCKYKGVYNVVDIIKPIGKNIISNTLIKQYACNNIEKIFYVPPYHNETNYMNLSQKLFELGINNKCERFNHHISELLYYSGIICIPYAWSTIALFERLQLGLVVFIPSIHFLIELSYGNNFWFQPPYNRDYNMLKLSEWYSSDFEDIFVYFDSWRDLQLKIDTTDYEYQNQKILSFAKKHEDLQLSKWKTTIDKLST
jgi:hypothetical protein